MIKEIEINQLESQRLITGLQDIGPLPKRFAGNGLTPEILTALGMAPDDTEFIRQITQIEQFINGSIKIQSQDGSIAVTPDKSSPFGWKTSTEVQISDSDPFTSHKVFLSFAQLLGHTLTMKGLTDNVRTKHNIDSINFAIPTPDNLTTLGDDFQTGKAMIWRQLFEPGYVDRPELVFPMDPTDKKFNQTLALTAAINRHVLAIACNALAHGHDLVLFNDARHEGPVLFKLISDWSKEHQVQRQLHTFHMAYLLLDSQNHLPDWVRSNLSESKVILEKASKQFFPGTSVADGIKFMTWKMLIQLMLQQETREEQNIHHHLLFQTSLPKDQLTLENIDSNIKPWFEKAEITIIPEVAASAEPIRPRVRQIAVSLGGSGHSESNQLIKQLNNVVRKSDIQVVLMGKGTDLETVTAILGQKPENNTHCLGFIKKESHDQLLTKSDVIIIKTSRNSREAIEEAVWSGQGVVLLPPETPKTIVQDIPLFQLSYLRETLAEHGHDLMLAIKHLADLGVDETAAKACVWQPESNISLQELADHALKATQQRNGALIPPQQLADIIIQITNHNL